MNKEVGVTVVERSALHSEAVAALVNEAYTIYPFMHGPRTDPEMIREEAGESGEFLLASDEEGLVGCALIKPSQDVDWSYAAGMGRAEPGTMYFGVAAVRPAAMRSGVGRTLLARGEAIARERGFTRMVLTTLEEMGLVEYYEPQGYSTVDTRPFGPDHWDIDIPHTLHLMEKEL